MAQKMNQKTQRSSKAWQDKEKRCFRSKVKKNIMAMANVMANVMAKVNGKVKVEMKKKNKRVKKQRKDLTTVNTLNVPTTQMTKSKMVSLTNLKLRNGKAKAKRLKPELEPRLLNRKKAQKGKRFLERNGQLKL